MAEAKVTLSADDTKRAVAVAVAATLTPEVMLASLASAIETMLEPKSWQGGKSQIQIIFEKAVEERTKSLVDEIISAPGPIRTELEALVREAVSKTLSTPEARDGIVKNVAGALGKALSGTKF